MKIKDVYFVFAVFAVTSDLVFSKVFETKKEAEEWVKRHPVYQGGMPLYIMKATRWRKKKTKKEEQNGSDKISTQ